LSGDASWLINKFIPKFAEKPKIQVEKVAPK
jgi:hypothetical protein